MSSNDPSTASALTKRFASKAMNGIKDLSDGYIANQTAETPIGSHKKRVTMAAMISGLSEIGIEGLVDDGPGDLPSSSESSASSYKHRHFTDKLIDKVLDRVVSGKEREDLRKKLRSSQRAKQQRLSVVQLTSDFKELSYRVGYILDLKRQASDIISWESRWKTITFMFLYTWICLRPYLLLTVPLILICCKVMIPKYLYRHPQERPVLLPVKLRGPESGVGFLNVSEAEEEDVKAARLFEARDKMFEQRLRDQGYYDGSETPVSSANLSGDEAAVKSIYGGLVEDPTPLVDSTATTSSFVGNINLIIDMRDLQNLLTNLVKMMKSLEDSISQACSFQNEARSTTLFYQISILCGLIFLFGSWIPWSFIFITLGWALILWNHPDRPAYIGAGESQPASSYSTPNIFGDLVIDEPPIKRIVSIFEIQKQNISDPLKYEPFAYSNSSFTAASSRRKQKKRPIGTVSLHSITAPTTNWKFSPGTSWKPDERDLELSDVYEKDGWLYDNTNEYRRRRLIREVYWST